MEFLEKNTNNGNDNFKNVILIIIILIFSYFIERRFPQSIIKNIYFFLAFIIIVGFILNYFFQNFFDKFKEFIKPILRKFPFFSFEEMKEDYNNKKLKKIKEVYQSGYLNNQKNNYINNNILINQNLNVSQPNYFQINENNAIENDKYLAKKISNIDKINKPFEKEYSIKNYVFYASNNNNDINNNYEPNQKVTNLPYSNSEKNEKGNYLGNKSILANPFNVKINTPYSNDSSGNYFLFSTNKKKNKNIFISTNNVNPINRFNNIENSESTMNFSDNKKNKIPKNKEASYNLYQILKKRNENALGLNQNFSSFNYNNDMNDIIKELAYKNYNKWIIKMKFFVSKKLIPNIIEKHDNNISNLNAVLNILGLKIISTSPETDSDEYLNKLNEKLLLLNSSRINDIKIDNYNLFYQNIKYDNYNNYNEFNNNINNDNKNRIFPSLNNFSSFLNDTNDLKENNNRQNKDKDLISVFFGDTNKIKKILLLIEDKINSLELQKNNENKKNVYSKRQEIIKAINYNKNPFIKKDNRKALDDYLKNINENNNYSLSYLQRLLYERIIINERLYPKELFDKKNNIHALLVIEYAIERFRDLQQNFECYGNGARGGEFLNENWCSLLPTDSQLIAHLIINYIESLYLISNNNNQYQQNFLLSFPMNYVFPKNNNIENNNNKTSIFLYQINPKDTVPIFNVVYRNKLIPCITDNMNLFHAFSIYFYLLYTKSSMFVMALGIHEFIGEIID